MSDSIDETIRLIEAEIQEKQTALRVLYEMSGRNKNINRVRINAGVLPEIEHAIELNSGFPQNARTDKQVMYLFDHVFTKGEKFATVQKKYNELLGTEKNIYNTCRALKKMGLLATVQYNNQKKLSFWGRKSWLDVTDFKEEFKPDQDELPIEINDIKILTDDEVNVD